MTEPKVIREYTFRGKVIGKIIEKRLEVLDRRTKQYKTKKHLEFQTNLSEFETIDLIREMSPSERIHLKQKVKGVYKVLKCFGINPEDYIGDEDLVIYLSNNSYKNLNEVCKNDHPVFELVKKRGLEKKIFPTLQPAD